MACLQHYDMSDRSGTAIEMAANECLQPKGIYRVQSPPMGMSPPCLKPELFGLIYLILESILEVFTLKTEHRTMSGDFIFILEYSSFLKTCRGKLASYREFSQKGHVA